MVFKKVLQSSLTLAAFVLGGMILSLKVEGGCNCQNKSDAPSSKEKAGPQNGNLPESGAMAIIPSYPDDVSDPSAVED